MKHEKYPSVSGHMLVTMPAEDWVWWCKFLNELLHNMEAHGSDVDGREDMEIILRTLQNAEEAEAVA